jgi:dolichol kinase
VWWTIKNRLLRTVVGLSHEERRQAFSSRMSAPYPLPDLLSRYSERRIRIVDMIGRRGRFVFILAAGLFFLYLQVRQEPRPNFITLFLNDNLADGIVFSWLNLALFHSSGFLARMFFGAQTRIMDGTLGRANCLLIATLWSAFKFVFVPVGERLAAVYPPEAFASLFLVIWGSYAAADSMSEIVGALFGRQRLRVWGIGDVNRKSVAGTVAGFVASLALCLGIVAANGMPASWIALSVVVSLSNTILELFSPRGTDDFTMATANALICWAFGVLIY